jgi:hypothetical protein
VTVELWMGGEFEYPHEMRELRAILSQMVEHFGEDRDHYLVLADFYCEGADIDLAIIKQRAVIVVELKECDSPVIGAPNGDWRIKGNGTLNTGRRNPYQQVRHYRFALMNHLQLKRFDFLHQQKASKFSFEHISGLVVFSPTMSPESDIDIPRRDQKWFGVLGLDDLWKEVKDRRSSEINLSHDEARRLATKALNLQKKDLDAYLGLPEPEPVALERPAPPEPSAPKVAPPAIVAPAATTDLGPDYDKLPQPVAQDIVNALRSGTVPETGLEFLAVGLDRELSAISRQLKHVATGRGGFKFVRGAYGAGKTFLGALVLEEALKQGFAVSSVVVSTDTPLYKLDVIYHRIITGLSTRGQTKGALKGLIDRWLYQIENKVIELEGLHEDDPRLADRVAAQIEQGLAEFAQLHSAFSSVIRGYYQAQLEGDYPTAQGLLGWLSGERHIGAGVKRSINIRGDIDNVAALDFLRGINAVARKAGMAGLAIVFDEVETIQRLRRPQREQSLNTLRQLVDGMVQGDHPYTYMMFTGTPGFFEDRQGIPALPPLHDRIKLEHPDEPFPNPELPQIVLPRFNHRKLQAVADKVLRIYGRAYEPVDPNRVDDVLIEFMIDEVTSKFGGRVDVVPRQFLRDLVNVLDKVRQYLEYHPEREYEFDRSGVADELRPEEREAIEPLTF